MKYHQLLYTIRQPLKIKETFYTEILNMTYLSYSELDSIITEIIEKIEYSPENYTALLVKNEKLKKKVYLLKKELEKANRKNRIYGLGVEEEKDEEDEDEQEDEQELEQDQGDEEEELEEEKEVEQEQEKIVTFKHVRKFNRAKDGKYHINGLVYDKLFGTREEVWKETAYQTEGCLIKDDLMISTSINHNGKIISKAKHTLEKNYYKNRFIKD
jgi:hypothetical protein